MFLVSYVETKIIFTVFLKWPVKLYNKTLVKLEITFKKPGFHGISDLTNLQKVLGVS
jgi:hypothetical protein